MIIICRLLLLILLLIDSQSHLSFPSFENSIAY